MGLKVAPHEVEPGHGCDDDPSREKKSTTVITMPFIAALHCDIHRLGWHHAVACSARKRWGGFDYTGQMVKEV